MTVVLREMRWWDIGPVLGLEAEMFPEDAWSAGMFWNELASARGAAPTRRYLVAERPDGRLAGYGGLGVAGGTGDILTIGVTRAHEGTGLGSRLLAALLAAAARFGCDEVLLEVRKDNARAQRLYTRFGFLAIGVRRGYYQPGNVDALVMRRELPPPPRDPAHQADPPRQAGRAGQTGQAAPRAENPSVESTERYG